MNQSYIGKIVSLSPIPNADRIVSAVVVCGTGGRWSGVVPKDQYQVGDLVTVFLQDSLLPATSGWFDWSFMERSHWIVRMEKFKGVPSECLIMPYVGIGKFGEEVSEMFGVTKYEKPLPLGISGDIAGVFPWFVPKTDEPNYQTVPEMVDALVGHVVYMTEKADGSSATFYKKDGVFGVCSRNYELKDTPGNAFWHLAHMYSLPEVLPDGYAMQAELVGPGVQKNPMGLKGIDMRVFNVFNISEQSYLSGYNVESFCLGYGFPMVKILDVFDWYYNSSNDDKIRRLAEGLYDNGRTREGVVIRPAMQEMVLENRRISFKIINLDYK